MRKNLEEEKILKQYSDLIYKLSHKYFSYYKGQYPIEDLYQEARLSTIKAYRTFDPNKKVKLITHIYNQIVFGFSHYARANTGLIKIPIKQINNSNIPKFVDNDFLYSNADNEENTYETCFDSLILDDYMNILTPRQIEIIKKIFIQGYTYDQVAKDYSISRQAVSQSVMVSFNKIRKTFENSL